MTKWGIRKRAAGLLALAAFALMVVAPASALAAKSTFTGGPDQYPMYVINDNTPFLLHFSAGSNSGLTTSTAYNAKVRSTIGTSPAGGTNRGDTWNALNQAWIANADNTWADFPSMSTNASGAIATTTTWMFARFGDDSQSGPYHLMISLSATTSTTLNSSIVPTVTVLDARTNGCWVHNGVATGLGAAQDVRATDAASTTVLSMHRTEPQGVDDDANFVVDDEHAGPSGDVGDFRMGVPSTTAIGIRVGGVAWTPANGFVSGPADTDLAIGADDTVAPSPPSSLLVQGHDTTASLTWGSATDDSAIAGYYVYRWTPVPLGSAYSNVHAKVATVGPEVTSFVDTGLTDGATYLYEVRAFDAATNIGPRSVTGTATPETTLPLAVVSPASPDGEDGWYVHAPTVQLHSAGGRTMLYSCETTPSVWTTYTAPVTALSGTSTFTYRDIDGETMGATSTLDFKVDAAAPTAFVSALPAISSQTGTSRTFTVSWVGTDTISGVAEYDVEYKAGATGAWHLWQAGTAATSQPFTAAAGTNVYFHVRAYDVAGNVSDWSTAVSTIVPFDETKAKFSSGWSRTSNSNYYLGTARSTSKKGGYATLSFTKGTLYLVTKTGPTMGKLAVYFAGKKVGTVNLHSSTTKYRQSFKLLTRSTGTRAYAVKLVNLGVSGHKRVEIDGFALKN